MKNTQNTTTNSITETNILSEPPQVIEVKACDMADIVGLLLFVSSELERMIELLKILADGKISAQLENSQRFALALTAISKGEYLADLAFGDAQSLNEQLQGTNHHKDFCRMLNHEISLTTSDKGQA